MAFTNDQKEFVKQHWPLQEWTAKRIGLELGVSRNSVIGWARRHMNISKPRPKSKIKKKVLNPISTDRSVMVKRTVVNRNVWDSRGALVPQIVPERDIPKDAVPLLDTNVNGCRFIFREGKPYFCCNKPSVKDYSYCEKHKNLIYVPYVSSRKRNR